MSCINCVAQTIVQLQSRQPSGICMVHPLGARYKWNICRVLMGKPNFHSNYQSINHIIYIMQGVPRIEYFNQMIIVWEMESVTNGSYLSEASDV